MNGSAALTAYLTALPDRCSSCGAHVPTQGHGPSCAPVAPTEGARLAAEGMSRATAAHPDEATAVDAAIRQLAATGRPFSANEVRDLTGVRGGVVGARFNSAAMRRPPLIRATGERVPSTDPATHAHRIGVYVGAAA